MGDSVARRPYLYLLHRTRPELLEREAQVRIERTRYSAQTSEMTKTLARVMRGMSGGVDRMVRVEGASLPLTRLVTRLDMFNGGILWTRTRTKWYGGSAQHRKNLMEFAEIELPTENTPTPSALFAEST
jgi:hypothetical protein